MSFTPFSPSSGSAANSLLSRLTPTGRSWMSAADTMWLTKVGTFAP